MKRNISCFVIALCFILAASQPVYAHTVLPVNPDAQPTTKAIMNWLAHLRTVQTTRCYQVHSADTAVIRFQWQKPIVSKTLPDSCLPFTVVTMQKDGLNRQTLPIRLITAATAI